MTQGVSIKSSLANSFIFRGVLFLVKIKNSLTSSLIFSLLQLVVTKFNAFYYFLYKQIVDIFESPCYQDLMRAGRNLVSLYGKVARSKRALRQV